ncbi:MAG: electron transfer flavoprotein subunit beta/FixA family protein [Elusimicrobiota bacterium]|nr:electron transfer flavoprotein subunit beta/FixA family protein [Elusimicrobiota bacterium]
MHIIVCIKQTPLTDKVDFDSSGNLIRDNIESGINPFDEYALEEALKIKDSNQDTTISALTMGPPSAAEVLRYAASKGCDNGYLISDINLKGSDTLATSYVLAKAIEKINSIEKSALIVCGMGSNDSDTGHVASQIAVHLNFPNISLASKILQLNENSITLEKSEFQNIDKLEMQLPAVASFEKNINSPRLVSIKGRLKSRSFKPIIWNIKDLNCDPKKIGADGSPTFVGESFTPPKKSRTSSIIEGVNIEEKCDNTAKVLKELKFI